jgi:serine/threonine protein kinase
MELGQGMHATVFMCFEKDDVHFERPYAVKISRESDEEKKLAHKNEYEILNHLSHENIVKNIKFYENDFKGEIYQVMEYIEGEEVLDNIA